VARRLEFNEGVVFNLRYGDDGLGIRIELMGKDA